MRQPDRIFSPPDQPADSTRNRRNRRQKVGDGQQEDIQRAGPSLYKAEAVMQKRDCWFPGDLSMYYATVLALMLVLPIVSIAIDWAWLGNEPLLSLAGKWFVFWSVGVRLLTAGLRQIANPGFTAEAIFKTTDVGARIVVQELGFANAAIGVVGLASLWLPAWQVPTAVYAALFYGAATVKHLANPGRNRLENVATVSDGWIAAVLIVVLTAG